MKRGKEKCPKALFGARNEILQDYSEIKSSDEDVVVSMRKGKELRALRIALPNT